jgi:hypothetical protein
MFRSRRLVLVVSLMATSLRSAAAADDPLRSAVTFYASFDETLRADFAGGEREPRTRYNDEKQPGKFVFEEEVDRTVFRIAAGRGVSGGALEPADVLPRNGRIFYPLRGNLAYDAHGWSGAVSVWCDTDPDRLLKTTFCDPIQITEKGANNGGIWFDFNDARPRDLRHGAFPAAAPGEKPTAESDPQAPLFRLPNPGWRAGECHHVVITWRNFDTGKPDAVSTLYIDGKPIGRIGERPIAMNWDIERAGLYTAVNYLGLLDELTLFGRELTAEEVRRLHAEPKLLAPLKQASPPGR